jgi:hypothetical protein
MEVKVDGTPKPTLEWYKEGTMIKSSPEFQIENFEDGTSVLTIPQVFPDDVGEIMCEAHNELGVATTVSLLYIPGTTVPYSSLPSPSDTWNRYRIYRFTYSSGFFMLFRSSPASASLYSLSTFIPSLEKKPFTDIAHILLLDQTRTPFLYTSSYAYFRSFYCIIFLLFRFFFLPSEDLLGVTYLKKYCYNC